MNVIIQKYGPPIAVIAIAIYLGWPPETPLDLGEDVVRAKSVRWKVSDLDAPEFLPASDGNPFAKVLVKPKSETADDSEGLAEAAPQDVTGPTELEIQQGIKLGGIAKTDRQEWAIVNRDVCRIGDQVSVIGLVDVVATIRDIEDDHITVVVGNLVTKIRTQERNSSSAKSVNAANSRVVAPKTNEQRTDEQEDDGEAESENQDDVPSGTTAVEKQKSDDLTRKDLLDAVRRGPAGNSLET